MQKISFAKNLSYYSLSVLLAWRFFISITVYWSGKLEIPYWEELAFQCVSYSLISAILWINKSDLSEINIDKNFVFLLIILGLLYSFLIPLGFGVALGAATLLNLGVIF